jgi:hypothetical protein
MSTKVIYYCLVYDTYGEEEYELRSGKVRRLNREEAIALTLRGTHRIVETGCSTSKENCSDCQKQWYETESFWEQRRCHHMPIGK